MPFKSSSYQGIHFRQYGHQGPWVVFFHGFCENMNLWTPVLPESERHQLLLIDLPGFGLSSSLTFDSLTAMGEQVVSLFNYLQIHNPILIGHSMGGYLAAEMLRSKQLEARALGMVHSTFHADSEEKKQSRDKTIAFLNEQPLEAFLRLFTEGLFAQHHASNPEFIQQANALVSMNTTRSVQSALAAMRDRSEPLSWLKESDLPVLIISGRFDRHVPPDVSLSEIAKAKRGMLLMLENSGHIGQIEEPELTKSYVQQFIHWVDDLQD